tara:strand:- start:4356 stop:5234 length:879 start_codon:yes stop_codon:yes gene_type:complete
MTNILDRHTPDIPESIWQGLPPDQENTYTIIKNKIILPYSGIPSIARQFNGKTHTSKRTINDQHLSEAHDIINSGKVKQPSDELLSERSISIDEVKKYNMLDTKSLVNLLQDATAAALTLKLPSELPKPHDIDGISIPVYSRGLFLGFATWVTNNTSVKYAFSIPNRTCFADDASKSEVTVVEGIFDAIALNRIETNAMALGDSQPNFFKMLMASKYNLVKLLFDNDLAGTIGCLKAFLILTKMLHKPAKDIIMISATNQRDPEEMINADDTGFLTVDYETMVNRLCKLQKS